MLTGLLDRAYHWTRHFNPFDIRRQDVVGHDIPALLTRLDAVIELDWRSELPLLEGETDLRASGTGSQGRPILWERTGRPHPTTCIP